jgi:hypothetical protein
MSRNEADREIKLSTYRKARLWVVDLRELAESREGEIEVEVEVEHHT